MLHIEASNPGNRTVTLSSAGVLLPGNKQLMLFPAILPYELLEGKNLYVWTSAEDAARKLKDGGFSGEVKLIGFFRDALRTVYKSKPLNFDVDEWIKPVHKLRG